MDFLHKPDYMHECIHEVLYIIVHVFTKIHSFSWVGKTFFVFTARSWIKMFQFKSILTRLSVHYDYDKILVVMEVLRSLGVQHRYSCLLEKLIEPNKKVIHKDFKQLFLLYDISGINDHVECSFAIRTDFQ